MMRKMLIIFTLLLLFTASGFSQNTVTERTLHQNWSFQEKGGDGDFDVDYDDLVDNDAEDAENFSTNYGFKSERSGGRWLPFKKEKSTMDLGGHRRALLQFEMRNPAMFLMGALLIIGMKIARIL